MQVNLDKSLDLMHNKQVGGVWLSLVERYVRDVEVAGSNPVTPTPWQGQGRKLSEFPVFSFYPCLSSRMIGMIDNTHSHKRNVNKKVLLFYKIHV